MFLFARRGLMIGEKEVSVNALPAWFCTEMDSKCKFVRSVENRDHYCPVEMRLCPPCCSEGKAQDRIRGDRQCLTVCYYRIFRNARQLIGRYFDRQTHFFTFFFTFFSQFWNKRQISFVYMGEVRMI